MKNLTLPIWLKGHVVVSGDLTEVPFQLLKESSVPKSLFCWGKGVDVGDVGHAAGHHFGSAVQLHGAGALQKKIVRVKSL